MILKLRTGTEIHANRGLISIVKNNKGEWELGEGYDGFINLYAFDDKTENDIPRFTQEELIELANIMINRWYMFSGDILQGKVGVK